MVRSPDPVVKAADSSKAQSGMSVTGVRAGTGPAKCRGRFFNYPMYLITDLSQEALEMAKLRGYWVQCHKKILSLTRSTKILIGVLIQISSSTIF